MIAEKTDFTGAKKMVKPLRISNFDFIREPTNFPVKTSANGIDLTDVTH
jgi:hypothetical protein